MCTVDLCHGTFRSAADNIITNEINPDISPHGASVGDLTGWETRPAPPKGSHVWTLSE
jgi:hypothetical protein